MVYTEIRNINGKKYYYRVISIRKLNKISKKRVYLGHDLSNSEFSKKERMADKKLMPRKFSRINKEIEKIKPKIIKILKKNNIVKAGIFGSYVRGEQKKDSDVDILIEPSKGMGLEFVGVKLELEDELGRKVDLVTYKGIHPYLRRRILSEEIRII